MPFWIMLLINVITFLVTELLRPKPNIEDAKPSSLGDFNVPTATEGRAVPLIWGRVKLSGPNVVWYGDLIADPITEKIKTGMFSSDVVTTGFRYFIGIQMALCRGPVDLLISIRNDESFAWGPDAPSADPPLVPTDVGAIYNIDEPEFYGGEEAGGGGGLVGGGRIFPGSETQAIAPYLSPFQQPQPAYRGTCYITWERGEIGLGPQLRPFAFEIERIPDGLDLATFQPGDEEIDLGANPMNVVFEVLTNTEWGLSRGGSDIDLVNFRAQAAILKTEGHGFAWVWDRTSDVLELIKLVEQQVDGILVIDAVTGLFSFTLVRFDYTPGTLPLVDETNIKKVTRYQRPTWAETQNQISLEFTDRRKNYTTSFALAQDMANQDIVKAMNTSRVRMPGVKNPTLANAIAWREIRALSTPIVTMKIVTDRTMYITEPGDVIEFSWDRFGITRLPIRVTSVDRGKVLENEITIDAAQDVFSFNAGSYGDPIDTGWQEINSEAQPSLRERLWEVPFQLSLDNERHLSVMCSRDGGLHISFDVQSDRISLPFGLEGTEADFTPTALIVGAISRDKGDVTPFLQDINVDGLNDITIAELIAAGDTTVNPNDPINVFLIDEELWFYESALDAGGGVVTLQNCNAGTFDTVPADHTDNSVVWFIGFGLGLLQRNGALPSPPGAIDVKILPQTVRNLLDISAAATLSTTVGQRILNPIPPGDPFVNGMRFHDLDGWTRAVGTLDFIWNTRNRSTQAFDVRQDDPDIQQAGDVGAHIIVRRVDTSAIVVERINIFSDQFIATDFIPQTLPGIPDELDFTAEITNRTTSGNEGQVATTRQFEVFGFGLNFGGDFGGDLNLPNNGIVLPQGAPPFTPDPVPGSGDERAWTIELFGTMGVGEDRRLLFDMFDNILFEPFGADFRLPQTSFPTLEDAAEEIRSRLATAIVDRPFTVTRSGARVTITTRFGDVGLRQQPPSNIVPLNFMFGPFFRQKAAPPRAAVRQKVYIDWFRNPSTAPSTSGLLVPDELSATNEIFFTFTSPTAHNILAFGGAALTFEQEQEFGGREGFGHIDSVRQLGGNDDRTQFNQEFYDNLRASPVAEFMEKIEGPLVLIPGFDFPMARASIAMEVRDNFAIRITKVANTFQGGIAFDGGGRGPGFPPAGGLKFLVKEGTPAVAGLPGGLAQVNGISVVNRAATVGTIISVTFDGTVFSQTVLAETNNYSAALGRMLDAIDLDARFDVINRTDADVGSFQVGGQIIRTVGNAPFDVFGDVGFGLRVEFRDVSP